MDLTRGTLYILLPLSVIVALVLVSQGVVQTISDYPTVTLVQPTTYDQPKLDANGNPVQDANGNPITETVPVTQVMWPSGPTASQVAIKHLGTNGGGFFNANSAHPFENPTPLTNFVEVLAETAHPGGADLHLRQDGGRHAPGLGDSGGDADHPGRALCVARMRPKRAAIRGWPRWALIRPPATCSPAATWKARKCALALRARRLFATATTATSNGAVNSMHDSYTPLGGLVPLVMMQFGEVILGGVGSGLYGMLVFAIVAVFIAGLMVGRTPEYLGKKIEAYEMKMASLIILFMPLIVLTLTGLAVVTNAGKAGISSANPGPHGFSEILYAYTSQGNNNGSAFAGLNGNTPFYNLTGALAMFFGRFFLAVPTLALAGSLARKKIVPAECGHAADPHAVVRRAAHQRGDHRRGAHLHPRRCAGADRRASDHDRTLILPPQGTRAQRD